MGQAADFYLSSAGEYGPLAAPRACQEIARVRDEVRNDHMLIEIEPPLVGQPFGLGDKDIKRLIISARHQRHTLYPISEWPAFVYVARILDDAVFKTLSLTRHQIELVAWATLFRTFDEAANYAKRLNR